MERLLLQPEQASKSTDLVEPTALVSVRAPQSFWLNLDFVRRRGQGFLRATNVAASVGEKWPWTMRNRP